MNAILSEEPNFSEPGRSVPAGLERIVRRCLEKDPARRFQNAADLGFAIEAVSGLTAAESVPLPAAEASAGKRSVAVLLFKDLGRNPENAHLGLGLADATITELATVRSLIVRPTAAILRYQDRSVDPQQAGRELGVEAVVDGSFQRSGSRLRVTVQLLSTSDGRPLWASKIDSSLDDIFEMQDHVSRKIAEALQVELTPSEERRLARAARPVGRAYELYLKGRSLLFRETLEACNAAIEAFEQARDVDPQFALAWAGLSAAYARMELAFEPERDWLDRAEAMCEKALSIDPALPEGRYLRGEFLWSPAVPIRPRRRNPRDPRRDRRPAKPRGGARQAVRRPRPRLDVRRGDPALEAGPRDRPRRRRGGDPPRSRALSRRPLRRGPAPDRVGDLAKSGGVGAPSAHRLPDPPRTPFRSGGRSGADLPSVSERRPLLPDPRRDRRARAGRPPRAPAHGALDPEQEGLSPLSSRPVRHRVHSCPSRRARGGASLAVGRRSQRLPVPRLLRDGPASRVSPGRSAVRRADEGASSGNRRLSPALRGAPRSAGGSAESVA